MKTEQRAAMRAMMGAVRKCRRAGVTPYQLREGLARALAPGPITNRDVTETLRPMPVVRGDPKPLGSFRPEVAEAAKQAVGRCGLGYKIKSIKELQGVMGLSLREAKEAIEAVHATMMMN